MNNRQFFRFGGACAVLGGGLGVIVNALHPRSSDIGEVEVELRLIRDHGEWLIVHMLILVTVVLIFPALVAITRSLESGPGAAWARLTLYSGIAALPVAFITVGIDGIAMKEMADAWATAGADQAIVLRAAEGVAAVGIASFDVFIITLFGVTPLLAGLALSASDLYAKWLGPVAIGSGVLGAAAGIVQSFSGLGAVTANVMFPLASLAFTVVIITAGVTLWQKADAISEASLSLTA